MYKEQIEAYFEKNGQKMLDDICKVIGINSAYDKSTITEAMPYGKGSYDALCAAAEIAEKLGMDVKHFDGHAITAKYGNKEDELAILAHMDVVPVDAGWSFPPFEGTIKDGKLYGRGSADDKGPAIAALYALAAAQAINPDMSKGTRVILGGAEEIGSPDIRYYKTKESMPPYSFSPDADYPIINLEKGSFGPRFCAEWKEDQNLPRVISIHGGTVGNIVPQDAHAVLEGIGDGLAADFCKKYGKLTGVSLKSEKSGKYIKISAKGVSSHSSMPENGNNAQTALLEMLANMPFAQSESFSMIKKLNKLFPHNDYYGEAIGVKMSDEESGPLTLNFGVLELNLTGFSGTFDSRVPVCSNEQNMADVAVAALESNGISVPERRPMNKPHYTPASTPFVQTLLKVYEQYTGEKGECIAIGGGTYVHSIEGGVAFGCSMPGTDNRMHGDDEFAVVDELMISAKMFAQVILDMCK